MLKNTLDKTMEKSMKLENKTKVSRFSNLRNINEEKSPEKELLMLQKISKYTKNQELLTIPEELEITEDSHTDKIPMIKLKTTDCTNLPFFISVQKKLSEVFCV